MTSSEKTDRTLRLVEAISGVLMAIVRAIVEDEAKHPEDPSLPPYARESFNVLQKLLEGDKL